MASLSKNLISTQSCGSKFTPLPKIAKLMLRDKYNIIELINKEGAPKNVYAF